MLRFAGRRALSFSARISGPSSMSSGSAACKGRRVFPRQTLTNHLAGVDANMHYLDFPRAHTYSSRQVFRPRVQEQSSPRQNEPQTELFHNTAQSRTGRMALRGLGLCEVCRLWYGQVCKVSSGLKALGCRPEDMCYGKGTKKKSASKSAGLFGPKSPKTGNLDAFLVGSGAELLHCFGIKQLVGSRHH